MASFRTHKKSYSLPPPRFFLPELGMGWGNPFGSYLHVNLPDPNRFMKQNADIFKSRKLTSLNFATHFPNQDKMHTKMDVLGGSMCTQNLLTSVKIMCKNAFYWGKLLENIGPLGKNMHIRS